ATATPLRLTSEYALKSSCAETAAPPSPNDPACPTPATTAIALAAQPAVTSFRAECPASLMLREAPGHRIGLPGRRLVEPGRSVEESFFDCASGKLVIAGTGSANTRFGEPASVTLSTSAALALSAAGSAASARTAIPFAISRAFAGSPAATAHPAASSF